MSFAVGSAGSLAIRACAERDQHVAMSGEAELVASARVPHVMRPLSAFGRRRPIGITECPMWTGIRWCGSVGLTHSVDSSENLAHLAAGPRGRMR